MRRSLILAGVLLTVVGLAGCSASMSSLEEATVPWAPTQDYSMPSNAGGEMAVEDAARSAADGDQRYIVNGALSLTVEQPVEAAVEAARIVERAGGRVDARSEQAPRGNDLGSARLTVRIPTERLTETLEDLKELGEVEHVEQSKSNVTSQSQDLDARISALRTSVDRLIALMADADTTADLISIESALSERQANLESLEAQKRSLDDQVALSTFDVYLVSEADAPVHEPDTFLSGLIAGWNAFVAFFAFILVAAGVLLPWLVFAAVVALVVVVLVRRRLKKRRAAVPAAPQSNDVVVGSEEEPTTPAD